MWIGIIGFAIVVVSTIVGYHSGLIRTVWSVASIVIALVLSMSLNPTVVTVLKDNVHLDSYLENVVDEKMSDMNPSISLDTITEQEQESYIEGLGLPEPWRNTLIRNNTENIYNALGVNSFKEYLVENIVNLLVQVIGYIIVFILIFLILRILAIALNLISKLPIIHGVNKIVGGVLGFIRGAALVWALKTVISLYLEWMV